MDKKTQDIDQIHGFTNNIDEIRNIGIVSKNIKIE